MICEKTVTVFEKTVTVFGLTVTVFSLPNKTPSPAENRINTGFFSKSDGE